MSLTDLQIQEIHNLNEHRDKIVSHLYEIEHILKKFFPEEFDIAYQHWIPQIITALFEDTKWLPRGQCSMEYTIQRLLDKATDKTGQGVSKYL